jgi:hypothetical protein
VQNIVWAGPRKIRIRPDPDPFSAEALLKTHESWYWCKAVEVQDSSAKFILSDDSTFDANIFSRSDTLALLKAIVAQF